MLRDRRSNGSLHQCASGEDVLQVMTGLEQPVAFLVGQPDISFLRMHPDSFVIWALTKYTAGNSQGLRDQTPV